jgi:hypothetical protein
MVAFPTFILSLKSKRSGGTSCHPNCLTFPVSCRGMSERRSNVQHQVPGHVPAWTLTMVATLVGRRKDIVFIDDDVADVNADAKFDPLDLRHRGILLSHTTLDLYGASRCIDSTGKLDEHTVAGRLNYPSAMRGDGGIDKRLSDGLEPGQHAFFVRTHQAAVSGNIRRQNCRPIC